MSGIAAIFNRDGAPVERAGIDRMLAAMAYRGPDGIGAWREGNIALGFAALHDTPESIDEHQPLSDETGEFHLVFDGRIDNRAELEALLRGQDCAPREAGDAALMLAAYRCWGEEAPLRILGDFAFALWDARRRRIFCARDCIGLKPFFYYCDDRRFICASDIGALLGDPRVPHEPNEAVVADYLLDRHRNRVETLYRKIMRLEPAHFMVIDAAGVTLRRYYDLPYSAELSYRSDDEYAEHFKAIFREAVRARLRSTGAVGAYLSGGLDSSSIVSMAQAIYREGGAPPTRFETYSLILPPPADEREFIDAVVERWNLSSNRPKPYVPDLAFLTDQVRRFRTLPEYPNAYAFAIAKRLARQQGVRVMLDGRGGDEWLQGARRHCADLVARLKLLEVIRWLRMQAEQARVYGFPFSAWRELLGSGVKPLLPPQLVGVLRRDRDFKLPWVNRDLLNRTGWLERKDRLLVRRHAGSYARGEFYENFTDAYLVIAHEFEERAAAWGEIEARTPFNDRRLIEFCWAAPEDQRRRSRTKLVLRNAMRGLLPESVRQRTTKAEFSAAFFEALRAPGLIELFEKSRLAENGWVGSKQLIEHYAETLRSYATDGIRYGASGNARYLWHLWNAVGLELWLRAEF